MLKFSLSYLAGALSVAVPVYYAGGRVSLVMFALGVGTVVLGLVALLSSRARLNRCGRFLSHLAATPTKSAPARAGRPAPVEMAPLTEIEAEVVSALENMKCTHKKALAATLDASRSNPGQTFEKLFRNAMAGARSAAKAS